MGIKEKNEEIPFAFIELEEDANITKEKIKSFLKKHLANYKLPKYIYFIEELPKNATGKVLKRKLREEIDKYKKLAI